MHREAIKFALLIFGVFHHNDNDDFEMLKIFGLSDEFAICVAKVLNILKRHDLIFYLAKKTRGWGRIAYIEKLEVYSDEVREWIIFEGYKNDVGTRQILEVYLQKANLLGYIKDKDFSESLYDVALDITNAFCNDPDIHRDTKEMITLVVEESKERNMNLERFSKLCDLITYLDADRYEEEKRVFSDSERENLLDTILYIGFAKGIDWEGIVRSNLTNYHARKIASVLRFDIWEDIYAIAKRNKHFGEWYALSLTNDKERYEKLCALAKERFDLESLKKGPDDEIGFSEGLNKYGDLEIIVQNLNRFDEIIGLDLVETLLQSPIVRSRNMALRAVESYKEIPKSIIDILKRNKDIEPNKDLLEKYEKILSEYEKANKNDDDETRLRLQIWPEYCSSGIWDMDGGDGFANVSYEYLNLPQDLADEFKDWQDTFDKYGLRWCEKNLTKLDKEFENLFYARGLELAKKLKMFFKHKAYVEYEGLADGIVEIKYYYVMSDYDCYLWDEEDCGMDLMCVDEDLELNLDREKMEDLHSALEKWSLECFDLEWDSEGNFVDEMTDELIERGEKLTQQLRDLLPEYCCVEFRE